MFVSFFGFVRGLGGDGVRVYGVFFWCFEVGWGW